MWFLTKSILDTKYKSHVVAYKFILHKIRDWCYDLSLEEKVWVTELASTAMSTAIPKVFYLFVVHYKLTHHLLVVAEMSSSPGLSCHRAISLKPSK